MGNNNSSDRNNAIVRNNGALNQDHVRESADDLYYRTNCLRPDLFKTNDMELPYRSDGRYGADHENALVSDGIDYVEFLLCNEKALEEYEVNGTIPGHSCIKTKMKIDHVDINSATSSSEPVITFKSPKRQQGGKPNDDSTSSDELTELDDEDDIFQNDTSDIDTETKTRKLTKKDIKKENTSRDYDINDDTNEDIDIDTDNSNGEDDEIDAEDEELEGIDDETEDGVIFDGSDMNTSELYKIIENNLFNSQTENSDDLRQTHSRIFETDTDDNFFDSDSSSDIENFLTSRNTRNNNDDNTDDEEEIRRILRDRKKNDRGNILFDSEDREILDLNTRQRELIPGRFSRNSRDVDSVTEDYVRNTKKNYKYI
jgi:hypothetical protein